MSDRRHTITPGYAYCAATAHRRIALVSVMDLDADGNLVIEVEGVEDSRVLDVERDPDGSVRVHLGRGGD